MNVFVDSSQRESRGRAQTRRGLDDAQRPRSSALRDRWTILCVSLGASCLLQACALLGGSEQGAGAPQPLQASQQLQDSEPLRATPAQRTDAQAAIASAEQRIALAKKAQPEFVGADLLIARARAALDLGAALRARRLADQAQNRAQALITDEYRRRAKLYRTRASAYTGLGDTQLDVLRRADVALSRSADPDEARQAYRMLKAFDQATRQATELYAVQPGDTLQAIAARPDIYGNAQLWPLIYEANLELIQDPSSLQPGWELTIRSHPRLQAVYRAIEQARGRAEVIVGPIRQSE